ncbi:MAG: sigma-54-dependent Fis family transcriptional regulator [Planctomycetes bacterium]|nr:sigma-54-dependent Fis family transcriptional regulator [Planctomycetota bacterium]
MRILLADDEPTIAITLQDALVGAGHQVWVASDTATALELLASKEPDVVLTDVRMPGKGGLEVLARSRELAPDRPVIVMTAFGTIDQAVEAMRMGAHNYVQKPFRNQAIVSMVGTLARVRDLEAENAALRAELAAAKPFEGFVGSAPSMRAVFDRIRTVAPTDATVLIEGESGTGKEVAARAIHQASTRSNGPFVALSCAALPETLLEAELFGHEKGAFTDARREKRGRFEMADKGTIFLDDIDDMPLAVQVKLLRVLQERTIERLGSETERKIDIRVVAATKLSLRKLADEKRFREDLYYRINVVPIHLPPLRERIEDLPILLAHMLQRHGGGRHFDVAKSTLTLMQRYRWPGNVRELENSVQRAVALAPASGELQLSDLVPLDERWRGATEVDDGQVRPLREVLRRLEIEHIKKALAHCGGHRSQTAELLGISRKVLWEKMRDFSITAPGEAPPEDEAAASH